MFLAGALRHRLCVWRMHSDNEWVNGVIESGFRIPWQNAPAPLTLTPIAFPPPYDPAAQIALQQEVDMLLSKEAILAVVAPHSPGFYSRLFAVPKANGTWRPVLDLSALNLYVRRIRFRMETVSSVRESIQEGDWAVSLDLRDAYFHILIHPLSQRWLRFVWNGTVYQFQALPFGLSLSPWVFTQVVKQFAVQQRRQGVRLRVYLDDWLILAQTQARCMEHRDQVMNAAISLGFCINLIKSELNPSQTFTYLGMSFDTRTMLVYPKRKRIDTLLSTIARLRRQSHASARQLASLLGMMESLAPLLLLGRVHKRPFQREVASRWRQGHMSWDVQIPLDNWFLPTTHQWMDEPWLSAGVPICPPVPSLELYTDASLVGWGAHVGSHSASGLWPSTCALWHINRLELEAVFLAVQHFANLLAGQSVLVCTDNQTVACYILHQGGTRSALLSRRAEQLLLWCSCRHIVLSARRIPGKINIVADALSRPHMVLQTEWTLTHHALTQVWQCWSKPHLDLFATRFSRRLPLYVSPVPDPDAWAVDALALSWVGLWAYAFPPLPLLSKVIRKARLDRPRLILIAPYWPAQPWFPELLELADGPPLTLSLGPRDLVQPRSGIPHGNVRLLSLHAWFLSGGHSVP